MNAKSPIRTVNEIGKDNENSLRRTPTDSVQKTTSDEPEYSQPVASTDSHETELQSVSIATIFCWRLLPFNSVPLLWGYYHYQRLCDMKKLTDEASKRCKRADISEYNVNIWELFENEPLYGGDDIGWNISHFLLLAFFQIAVVFTFEDVQYSYYSFFSKLIHINSADHV